MTKTASSAITVSSTPAVPVVNFSPSVTSGTAPLTVAFSNTTTGSVTTWAWDFGDGTSSNAQSPTHIYTVAGIYRVTLTATGPGGSASKALVTAINVAAATTGSATSTVNFTASPSSGVAPLSVAFTNTTTERLRGGPGISATAPRVTPQATSVPYTGGPQATTLAVRCRPPIVFCYTLSTVCGPHNNAGHHRSVGRGRGQPRGQIHVQPSRLYHWHPLLQRRGKHWHSHRKPMEQHGSETRASDVRQRDCFGLATGHLRHACANHCQYGLRGFLLRASGRYAFNYNYFATASFSSGPLVHLRAGLAAAMAYSCTALVLHFRMPAIRQQIIGWMWFSNHKTEHC